MHYHKFYSAVQKSLSPNAQQTQQYCINSTCLCNAKKYKTDRNVHHVQQRVKIDRQIETVWLSCKTTILPGCKPPSATLCGSVISPDNK
ncbi:hypothetical protein D917_01690 [Trichinella nativa]|uniref:Uncharacterized protein n=1 Tax=Trichinella nativa TaxID=6335 RepID=A0A1Y3ESJ1_9BILA|nr:hypothetical protein D917_01690 [Trichinella nativa]